MDADGRTRLAHLIREVMRDPGHHGLFATLRRIERLKGADFQWGRSTKPGEDPIRLGQNLSLAFEGREIAAVHPGQAGQSPKVLQNLMTLVGPAGPMPLHFAEMVREREFSDGDPVLARFLDVIMHRILTLHYRAWSLNQASISADHGPGRDGVLRGILSLMGLGAESLKDSGPIDSRSLAARLGPLSRPSRGIRQLQDQLSRYFELPVRVEDGVACQSPISPGGRWTLTRPRRNQAVLRLGAGLPIGKTTVCLSNRFRIVIGPLAAEEYERFLPDQKSRRRLEEWVRYYVGSSMDWDLVLLMDRTDAREWKIGRGGNRLRRDIWLGRKRPENAAPGYHRRFEPIPPSTAKEQ